MTFAPDAPQRVVSIRQAAANCMASKSAVDPAVKALESGSMAFLSQRPILNDDEGEALIVYVIWIQRGGFPAIKKKCKTLQTPCEDDETLMPLILDHHGYWAVTTNLHTYESAVEAVPVL